MTRPKIYRKTICTPTDEIEVYAGLSPNTEYQYWIEDKHGNSYSEAITTDSNGCMVLPLANFPDGLFNHAAGLFMLTIYDAAPYYNEHRQLIFECSHYDQVLFDCKICDQKSVII